MAAEEDLSPPEPAFVRKVAVCEDAEFGESVWSKGPGRELEYVGNVHETRVLVYDAPVHFLRTAGLNSLPVSDRIQYTVFGHPGVFQLFEEVARDIFPACDSQMDNFQRLHSSLRGLELLLLQSRNVSLRALSSNVSEANENLLKWKALYRLQGHPT